MFGGLDLKGSTAKKDPPKVEEAEKQEAPSAFSFLANSATTTSAAPVASGFSFLNAAPSSEPSPDAEKQTDVTAAASATSAFGFMAASSSNTISSTPAADESTGNKKPEEDAAPPPPPPAGAFDFLQQPATTNPMETPPGSSSPVVTSDDLLSVANISNQPTGAGVVFANTAKRKTVKKRSRTAKIGAGATAATASLPPPSALPTPMTRTVSEDSTKLAEAASEASRRAEEFIHSKFKSESVAVPPSLETVKSEDDDVIVAAKAAAAEAKQMQQQQMKSSSFSKLFRGRSPTPKPVSSSSPATSTSVDRLQQEQQDAKRAMAERQLQMQKETTTKTPAPPPAPSSFNISVTPTTFAPPKATQAALAPAKAAQSSFGLQDILSTPQTPTDKFNKILEEFETQVSANMDQLTRLNSQKRGFLEDRTVVTARMQLAQSDAESCQNQQSAAAEAEDFDTAAQLSEMIQEYEQEQANCKAKLDNIDATVVEIDKQVVTTVATIEKLFQGLKPKLEKFAETQNEDSDAAATIEQFSKISKQLSAEHDRLQNDYKHLERDLELVTEERNELEKAISEQSGEYEKLRDQARSKLQETESEIEALRRELDQKQREAAKLRTEAAGHDEAVLRVRVKFSRQIARVQTKEMTIQDHKEDWETEKKAYDAQKEAHDAQVEAHSEALVAKDKLDNNLKMQITESESFGGMIAEVIREQTTEKMVSTDAELQAEVVQHQADVRKCQVSLDSAKSTVSSLQREIEFLVNDIPVFEEMKKAAAARRDFKAASKASKDIKEATVRLATAQEELQGEATSREKAAEADLEAAKAKLEAAQQIALAKEKESVVGIMAEWAETLKRLSATVKDLEDGLGVHAAAKYCLVAQINALRAQGEAYGEKYGGWRELIADIEGDLDKRSNRNPPQSSASDNTVQSEEGGTKFSAAEAKNVSVTEPVQSEDPDTSSNERMKRFLAATARLKIVEEEVEAAAEAEDYEKAAVLDEELQELLALVESLNLTDEEMEQALSMELAASSQDQDDNATSIEGSDDIPDRKPAIEPCDELSNEANVEPEGPSVNELSNEASLAPEGPSVNGTFEGDDADVVEKGASSEDEPSHMKLATDDVAMEKVSNGCATREEDVDQESVIESNGLVDECNNPVSDSGVDVPEQAATTDDD